MKITPSYLASKNPIAEFSSSYIQKYGILLFLPEDGSRMRFYFIFSKGDSFEIMVLED